MFHGVPVRAIRRSWRNLRGFCGVVPIAGSSRAFREPARRGTVDGVRVCSAMLIRRALACIGRVREKARRVRACRALRGCSVASLGKACRFRIQRCGRRDGGGRMLSPCGRLSGIARALHRCVAWRGSCSGCKAHRRARCRGRCQRVGEVRRSLVPLSGECLASGDPRDLFARSARAEHLR